MQAQTVNTQGATHEVEYAGEVRFCNPENYVAVLDELIAAHGAGSTPKLTPIAKTASAPAVTPAGEVDKAGEQRSNNDRFEARLNGFSPRPPIYAVGTRVNEIGVRNAESSRREYDALPNVTAACASLIQTVNREVRRDINVERISNIRMTEAGLLKNEGNGLKISETAFGGLLTRTGIGGHSYLSKCPPALRATNVNHWMTELMLQERAMEADAARIKEKFEPRDAKFRTRMNHGEREIFAVVSGSYGAFDVDKVATALSMAAPEEARGSVVYDGTRAKFEVLFHSNVQPSEYVAGEFFKAGVLIRTDDTGGGAIRISAVVWQNLCLNLIILDECVQPIAAIRHIGSVAALAKRFEEGFKQALGTIDGFMVKWGYALNDDVTADYQTDELNLSARPISEVLPGLFNGIIERELVPVRGQRKDAVQGLLSMYAKDDSAARAGKDYISRAAVVNAFTRYAHEVNTDPFAQDEIERAAGRLLNVTRENKILPYEPIDF